MLVLTRKVGEEIVIADVITLKIQKIKGNQIQIAFEAPKDVEILRKEIYERKNKINSTSTVE
jgi:carbon storage regulator